MSRSGKTSSEDELNCIKLLPFYPNSSSLLRLIRNKRRPLGVVFFLKTSDVQHCRLLIEVFTIFNTPNAN